MEQYIPKSALVAEIEKKIKQYKNERNTIIKDTDNLKELSSRIIMCQEIISFLDTLEVKEVDLKEELNTWRHDHFHGRRDNEASGEYLERVSQLELAKHFFELGLKIREKNNNWKIFEDYDRS